MGHGQLGRSKKAKKSGTSLMDVPLPIDTVKLGDKERFDKGQIGVKEPFPETNCQSTS